MKPLPPNADELVSAYLDGEAAPDEIAVVESSPELMERVEALRAVSDRLAAPLSPPPVQKETHLAAALGLFDEMFDTTNASQQSATSSPGLRAVPSPAESANPSSVSPPVEPGSVEPPSASAVTSLDAARERRKPRRFNIGVIAAALAALLLIVGLAVLSGGRGTDDVASTAPEAMSADAAEDTSADEGEDTSSISASAADDDADAMDDAEEAAGSTETQGGLSEVDEDRVQPLPTADPPAAAAPAQEAAEEAMEDEAANDDADAMDDAEEADGEASADEAAPSGVEVQFFLGEFDEVEDLEAELDLLSTDGLYGRGVFDPDGRFACIDALPELANIEGTEIVGDAIVGTSSRTPNEVEIYTTLNDDGSATVYIVDSSECSIISEIIAGG